jgi:hypothetical protein
MFRDSIDRIQKEVSNIKSLLLFITIIISLNHLIFITYLSTNTNQMTKETNQQPEFNGVRTADSYEFAELKNVGDVFTGVFLHTMEMEFKDEENEGQKKRETVYLFADYTTGEEKLISGFTQIVNNLNMVHELEEGEFCAMKEEERPFMVFRYTITNKGKTQDGSKNFTRFNIELMILTDELPDETPEETPKTDKKEKEDKTAE